MSSERLSAERLTTLPLNFCLEGFRLMRQRPQLIAYWGAVTLFGNLVAILLVVALAGPSLQGLAAMATSSKVQPDLFLVLLQSAVGGVAAFIAVTAVTASVVTAAVCRAVLGEEDERLGFLRFGMREVQQTVLYLIMTAFSIAIFFACFVLAGIPAAVFAAVPGAMPAFGALATVTAAGCIFWLRVRLSLNAPQSFVTGRIDVFGSFALTRGYFRPLAFGYVSAIALAIVVELLCAQVTGVVLIVLFGDIATPDLANLAAFLTPANTLDLILTHGIVSPLVLAILYGAPVAAYSRLVGPDKTRAAESVF